jgi:hypothetical protein
MTRPDTVAADYDPVQDVRRSFEDAYSAIRERKAAGGKGWPESLAGRSNEKGRPDMAAPPQTKPVIP